MLLTRGAIRDRVRILVSDSGPTGGDWVDGAPTMYPFDTYNRFIDDALRAIYALVPWPEVEQEITAVVSQSTYEATQLTTIEVVDYDNRPLQGITKMRLERMDEKWRTKTGQPLFYVLNAESSWSSSAREFRLYPIPDTADTIRVIGRWYPTDLYSDWIAPALPGWLHEAIPYEAAAMILESPTEHRNDELAAAYREVVRFYTEAGLFHMGNRYPEKTTVRGEFTRAVRGSDLVRNPHIPFTGQAPGEAE